MTEPMTDRPIIYSTPMVLALLTDRKTMTRRLATSPLRKCAPGDRLWVRETWAQHPDFIAGVPCAALFRAESMYAGMQPGDFSWKWRPSIHMPRWASRLTLTVTSVKIERLQEISEEDAKAEGVQLTPDDTLRRAWTFRAHYAALWDSLHGGAWAADPTVVAISFSVERRNIDAGKAPRP